MGQRPDLESELIRVVTGERACAHVLAASCGLPAAFGLQAATLLVLVPTQLGAIALAARLRTGSWRLRGALGYTERLPPRLEHHGAWAPVINTVLFAVYHIWSPW